MPTVIYIDANDDRHEEEVQVGFTLMDGAFNRQIPGMVAECGGAAACGTCHCFVDEAWTNRLPPVEDLEDSMLYLVSNRRDNSRLACQVYMTQELDGIEVHISPNNE
ncbi:MAG: 2Fe-2S iron-sulfur cluster-binding protein [Lysobacterales bacterium]